MKADHLTNIMFTGGWLDRADKPRADAAWLKAAAADPRSRFLPFSDLRVGMIEEPTCDLAWIERSALITANIKLEDTVLLGIDENEAAYFAIALNDADAEKLMPPVSRYRDARSAAFKLGDSRTAVLAQARTLLDWHHRHRFCAVCGQPSTMERGGAQRRCTSSDCNAIHFPRTDPVVIMLVESPDGKECLLGRGPAYPDGLVSCLAGFMEPGESIEEAVRRELKEEAGIDCEQQIRYFASQPWPFPASLMIACFVRATSKQLRIDEDELEWARWFSRAELERVFSGTADDVTAQHTIAIAHHMIRHWLDTPVD